jgi:hypothetical protein
MDVILTVTYFSVQNGVYANDVLCKGELLTKQLNEMNYPIRNLAIAMAIFFPSFLLAQKSAGIYYLTFLVQSDIMTLESNSEKRNGFFTGSSTSVSIPDNLVDTIKLLTERTLSQKMNAKASCVYAKTKGGKTFDTTGMEGGTDRKSVEGLPFANFNKAEEQFKKDLYVQMQVLIENGKGVNIDFGDGRSKIKPMITLTVKAFDKNKKMVWKHKVKLKNLAKLKRWKEETEKQERKSGQVLSAEMIVEMYRLGLEEFLQESK